MSGFEIALGVLGSVVSAVGAIQQGNAQAAQLEAQSEQLKVQAQWENQRAQEQRAIGQREAQQRHKEAERVMSRQQAVAAASGGSATDPTVLDLMGDTGAQGDINAQTALWEGETKGRGLDFQAAIDRNSASINRMAARAARTAGYIGAGSAVISGFSSFARYQPSAMPTLGGGNYTYA